MLAEIGAKTFLQVGESGEIGLAAGINRPVKLAAAEAWLATGDGKALEFRHTRPEKITLEVNRVIHTLYLTRLRRLERPWLY